VVLVGIGIVANDDLAASAGLEVNGGIVVDARLLTRDQRISAIGDCARYPSPYASSPVRVESVQNAIDQGRWVASRLTGGDGRFTAVPWFWSDQGAMKLRMAGLRHPDDQTLVWGNPETGAFSVFSFRDGALVACDCVNRPSDQMSVRQLLQLNVMVRRDQFDDPKFTLKELVPNLRGRDAGSPRQNPRSLPT
jgi:3-phenylpropionate/trans-cinnamate dioxygenase ferredoxin reductase component